MAKDPYAGLERTIVELPFTDGLANNFAKHFRAAPKDALYAIDNADLSSVGKFSNRDGFVSLSNARIGEEAGYSSLIGSHEKLFQHKDELGSIADTNFPIGSGAGWGGTGDTVYTFVPDTPATSATGAWKAHGKIPRPTLSCVSDITSDTAPRISDIAVAGKFALIAWHSTALNLAPLNSTGQDYGRLWFKVVDITNNATVIDTSTAPTPTGIIAEASAPPGNVAGNNYQAKINCLAIGNTLYCFYLGAVNLGSSLFYNAVCVFTVDMTAANPVAGGVAILASSVVNYSACTDGTNIFLAYLPALSPNQGVLSKFSAALALLTTTSTANYVFTVEDFTLDTGAGEVALATVYTHAPDVRRIVALEAYSTSTLALVTTSGPIFDTTTLTPTTHILRGPFYGPDVVVLAAGQYAVGASMKTQGANYGQFLWAFSFRNAGTASAPTANYVAGGVWAIGKMIRINGRTYVPALRCDVAPNVQIGSELGYFLLELDTTAPANVDDLYRTPLVAANWATDVAACAVDANNTPGTGSTFAENQISLPRGCVAGNTYYLMTRKGASLGTRSSPYFDSFVLEMMQFNFADPYRWASRVYGDITAFAGGAMFAYDGRRTFECGILTRPRIVGAQGGSSPGSGWVVGAEYFIRAVYTWLDNTGQRWFSAPSYAARPGDAFVFTAGFTTASLTIDVTTPPTFSGMCSGVDFFANAVEIWIYMTNPAAATGVYYLAGKVGVADAIANNFTPGYSPVSGLGVVRVVNVVLSPPPFTADQLYTVGGELENSPAPACRTIEAHRDRLFTISSYDNNVYYTKPKVAGRGIEWCQQTLRIPLMETGLGLASNETCLMIFTNRGVYAIEGYGPSATGQPAQAFGPLQLISNQLGLYEVNSCLSTPVGVIFRTSYGWYLVDRTLTITFIGNDINGMVRADDKTLAISVEQSKSCIRILMQSAGATTGFVAYNYWYDSQRWSTDSSNDSRTYRDAMTFKETYCAIDSNDVLARQGANFGGTSWNDGASDAFGHGIRVETGWITVANMAMYKRIWRVIATVENLTPGDPQNPMLNLQVFADWRDTPVINTNFTADKIGPGVQTIRAHLPVQKMKAIRIVLQQVYVTASQTYTNNPGYNFIGLGFEIGLKNRLSPEPVARST